MTDDLIKLARRAVACKNWRWMPGMRTVDSMRVIHDPDRWPDRPCAIREGGWVDTAPPRPLGDDLPDLSDAATVGCLLALVREAWGDPFLCPAADRETGWWLNGYAAVDYLQSYRSEAEALVAALESAP